MSDPAEGLVCIEITIAPDGEGVPFSASGVLFLRATVRWAPRQPHSTALVTFRCRTVFLHQVGRTISTGGDCYARYISSPLTLVPQRLCGAEVEICARKQQPPVTA